MLVKTTQKILIGQILSRWTVFVRLHHLTQLTHLYREREASEYPFRF